MNATCCIKNGFLTLVEDSPLPLRKSSSLGDLNLDELHKEETLSFYEPSEIVSELSCRELRPVSSTRSGISVTSDNASSCENTPWRNLDQFVNENPVDPTKYTTVMVRNIPAKYSLEHFIEEILATGNQCNFVHLPLAKKRGVNLGYAFVNFVTADMAQNFLEVFQDRQFDRYQNSDKRASVMYASLQGFEANVQFYSGRRIAGTKRAPWVLQ
jgi:RNA recognition motif-containing protein